MSVMHYNEQNCANMK